MISRCIITNISRGFLTCSALVLSLGMLSGCGGDTYPEDLHYPVRTDPLVQEPPKTQPVDFDKPGELVRRLDDLSTLEHMDPDKNIVLFPRRDPRTGKAGIKDSVYDKIGPALEKFFGTPRAPLVLAGKQGITPRTQKALRLDRNTLARGSRLYRLHCVHCHGLSGDGRGPTAPWVNPHPRDYRQGIFKFTSSKQDQGERKPRRSDLLRTLRQGVEGTSMPAFNLLPQEDLEAMASYVTHLSLRGQTEFLVMVRLLSPGQRVKKLEPVVSSILRSLAQQWNDANLEENLISPPREFPYPYKTADGRLIQPGGSGYSEEEEKLLQTSVRNGQQIFKDPSRGGCIGCHFDYGRQSAYFYDAWGTIVRPANLTIGIFRGGRRPIDLYWRIHSGINGANMAPLANLADESPRDREARIWDLVNFVQVLPYPEMRRKYGVEIDSRPSKPSPPVEGQAKR